MRTSGKKRTLCTIMLAVCLLLVGCQAAEQGGFNLGGGPQERPSYESTELQFTAPAEGDTIAIFSTSLGEIRAVLYPELVPLACANFIGLAQQGYYNGIIIHRVVPGFVVQSGDATGNGNHGTTYWNGHTYPLEPSDLLHHYSGALCAAFSDKGEGNSQFYFMQTPPQKLDVGLQTQLEQAGTRQAVLDAYNAVGGAPYLDYTDTVFGQVYQGMDVLDAIAQVELDEAGRPLTAVTLDSVTISAYTSATPAPAESVAVSGE